TRSASRTSLTNRSVTSSRLRCWLRVAWLARIRIPSAVRRDPSRWRSRARCSAVRTSEPATSQTSSTRVEDVFTCWPPGPLDRDARYEISLAGTVRASLISIEPSSIQLCVPLCFSRPRKRGWTCFRAWRWSPFRSFAGMDTASAQILRGWGSRPALRVYQQRCGSGSGPSRVRGTSVDRHHLDVEGERFVRQRASGVSLPLRDEDTAQSALPHADDPRLEGRECPATRPEDHREHRSELRA